MNSASEQRVADRRVFDLVERERQAYWDEIQPDLAVFRALPEEVAIRATFEPIVPLRELGEFGDIHARSREMERLAQEALRFERWCHARGTWHSPYIRRVKD